MSVARIAQAVLAASLRRPGRTLVVWGFVALVATSGVARLRVDTSTESVLDRSSPPWRFYQESLRDFGGDEIVVVALEGERPFDPDLLRFVSQLTDRLERLPSVRRVDSLSTVPLIRGRSDGSLELEPALAGGNHTLGEDLQRQILGDRIAPRALVSQNGRVIAVNVILEQNSTGYRKVVEAIRTALEGRTGWVSGVPVYRTVTNSRIVREVAIFVPLTILAIAAVLILVFRSVRAVGVPLVTAGVGTWVLIGVMGAADVPLTISTMILPTVLLALGCAYAMHLLAVAAGRTGEAELARALGPVALPVALSGLTTAIGFAAMCAIRIDAIRYVGALGAIGVSVVGVASLTLAPALLRFWPLPPGADLLAGRIRRGGVDAVLRLAGGRPHLVMGMWFVAIGCVALGATRLHVETDVTRWFEPGTPVRDSYEAIRRELSGITPMNVVIRSESGEPVTSPAVLQAVDGLASYLADRPQVGKVLSIADPLRQLHGGFMDDPSEPLPDSREMIEQYLLLLESVPQIDDLLTADRRTANILIRLDNNGSRYLLDLAQDAEQWWRANGVPGFSARTTGVMFEFARAADEISFGQIRGLGLAFAAIGVVLLVLLRSPGLAAVALLPNVLPILVAFGGMGLAGVTLDAGTVLIGNLALGIAVDDTVHVVTAFHAQRQQGIVTHEAVSRALRRTLPALLYTTAAVSLGFGVLGLSQFVFIRNLGVVTALLMLLCLATDLNLLLAVLLRREGRHLPRGASA